MSLKLNWPLLQAFVAENFHKRINARLAQIPPSKLGGIEQLQIVRLQLGDQPPLVDLVAFGDAAESLVLDVSNAEDLNDSSHDGGTGYSNAADSYAAAHHRRSLDDATTERTSASDSSGRVTRGSGRGAPGVPTASATAGGRVSGGSVHHSSHHLARPHRHHELLLAAPALPPSQPAAGALNGRRANGSQQRSVAGTSAMPSVGSEASIASSAVAVARNQTASTVPSLHTPHRLGSGAHAFSSGVSHPHGSGHAAAAPPCRSPSSPIPSHSSAAADALGHTAGRDDSAWLADYLGDSGLGLKFHVTYGGGALVSLHGVWSKTVDLSNMFTSAATPSPAAKERAPVAEPAAAAPSVSGSTSITVSMPFTVTLSGLVCDSFVNVHLFHDSCRIWLDHPSADEAHVVAPHLPSVEDWTGTGSDPSPLQHVSVAVTLGEYSNHGAHDDGVLVDQHVVAATILAEAKAWLRNSLIFPRCMQVPLPAPGRRAPHDHDGLPSAGIVGGTESGAHDVPPSLALP